MITIDFIEAATILTKAALENGTIKFKNNFHESDEQFAAQNVYNAQQVADFYSKIYETVKSNYHQLSK